MTGPWGPAFGPLDLEITTGGVTALIGPAGSGRVGLLMCLAGRMKPSAGTLSVFGKTRARDIFVQSALAGIEQLDSIFESVTVRDLLTEQSRWDARWYRLVGRAGEAEREAVCRPVFGDLPLPSLTEYVEELDELNGMLLRIALANTARPPLLVVGSIDQVTSDRQRETLIRRLVELGEQQTVITTSANEIESGLGVRSQISVENLDRAELIEQSHGRHEKGDD
ncbi:ATP-binding cassette domain-containing protein [Mycobacterium sp. M1]|uniref:ATP-binding cassette domain-containing protein n=1 Tax=Mycolicibacter acidiphilus TaxID=2835306 RepID=A0ABS5RL33_9MYCO|nr:ATP-binding cassette domain-containing protein [Mycolicibacter acidiphilus]